MPKFSLDRSIEINASPEKVFNILNDLNTWKSWSPWLIMDPDTTVEVAADAKSYSWDGNRTGSGNMKILSENAHSSIDFDLNFIKPWKSNAKVNFKVKEMDGGSKVTWGMTSSVPFYLFFMKKMMMAFIGNDYERGLNLLKDYVEDGKVHSKLSFIGENAYEGHQYLGIKRTCGLEESGEMMKADFGKLSEYSGKQSVGDMANAFTMYHKWNFVKKICTYTAGMPIENTPSDIPSDFFVAEIPSTKIYTLEHAGPYKNLGNAWSTMYNMQRQKEFKMRTDIHPFETYKNDPSITDPNELITHVNFAVK